MLLWGCLRFMKLVGNPWPYNSNPYWRSMDYCIEKITFVKDESNNLIIMATTLQLIVDCEPLKLLRGYEGTCFGHIMSTTCQYATNDDKVSIGLRSVNVKDAHVGLQKIITWTKKYGKGRQEWEQACCDNGMRHQKLKIPMKIRFASKVICLKNVYNLKTPLFFVMKGRKLWLCNKDCKKPKCGLLLK